MFFQFLDAGAILVLRNNTTASGTVLRYPCQSQVKGCISLWASSGTCRVTQALSCAVLSLFPPFPVRRRVPHWPVKWEWWWGVPVIHMQSAPFPARTVRQLMPFVLFGWMNSSKWTIEPSVPPADIRRGRSSSQLLLGKKHLAVIKESSRKKGVGLLFFLPLLVSLKQNLSFIFSCGSNYVPQRLFWPLVNVLAAGEWLHWAPSFLTSGIHLMRGRCSAASEFYRIVLLFSILSISICCFLELRCSGNSVPSNQLSWRFSKGLLEVIFHPLKLLKATWYKKNHYPISCRKARKNLTSWKRSAMYKWPSGTGCLMLVLCLCLLKESYREQMLMELMLVAKG